MAMTGFEPGSSGVESDNSANCVATTDQCRNENRNIKYSSILQCCIWKSSIGQNHSGHSGTGQSNIGWSGIRRSLYGLFWIESMVQMHIKNCKIVQLSFG